MDKGAPAEDHTGLRGKQDALDLTSAFFPVGTSYSLSPRSPQTYNLYPIHPKPTN